MNNLPAAMLLSAHTPAHPRALLLGLDLGPNLAVTGSLSGLRYSLLGCVLAPVSIASALLAAVRF